MSDEIIDSLKQAFMKEANNTPDECPMADQVSDYAFGELGPDDSSEVQEHLKSCRSCLDMYMDIKMAEEEAEQVKHQGWVRLWQPFFQQHIHLIAGKRPRKPNALQHYAWIMMQTPYGVHHWIGIKAITRIQYAQIALQRQPAIT